MHWPALTFLPISLTLRQNNGLFDSHSFKLVKRQFCREHSTIGTVTSAGGICEEDTGLLLTLSTTVAGSEVTVLLGSF